jgi:hypothetical protein
VKSSVSLNLIHVLIFFRNFFLNVFFVYIIIFYNKNKVFLFHLYIFVYLDASLEKEDTSHSFSSRVFLYYYKFFLILYSLFGFFNFVIFF